MGCFRHCNPQQLCPLFHALESLELGLRKLFLQLHIDLIGDYRQYVLFDLQPPVFNVDAFIESKDSDSHEFYK